MNNIIIYIITTILGLIIGFLVNMINNTIKQEKTEKKALKCLIRTNIVSQYYVYREIGHIPYYVKESIMQEFEAYKELGGNSFVKNLIDEIQNWKVEK